jgi:hypothetical protein
MVLLSSNKMVSYPDASIMTFKSTNILSQALARRTFTTKRTPYIAYPSFVGFFSQWNGYSKHCYCMDASLRWRKDRLFQ